MIYFCHRCRCHNETGNCLVCGLPTFDKARIKTIHAKDTKEVKGLKYESTVLDDVQYDPKVETKISGPKWRSPAPRFEAAKVPQTGPYSEIGLRDTVQPMTELEWMTRVLRGEDIPRPEKFKPGFMTDIKVNTDMVNHPQHYNKHPSGVECIDIIRWMPHNVGAVMKYLWRAGKKDPTKEIEDLKKAKFYLEDEIKRLEKLREEA